MADKIIKQIQVDSTTIPHELDAKYWNGHIWSELGSAIRFIGEAQTTQPASGGYIKAIISGTTYYIPQESGSGEIAAKKGDVFIIASSGREYLCTKAGTSAQSTWVILGDEQTYASKAIAGKAGTYTVTCSDASGQGGAQTATGTATVTYKKSATATGSNTDISTPSVTEQGGAVSINYTPEGKISGSQSIGAHSHTVTLTKATVTYIDSVAGSVQLAGAHTHSVSGAVDITVGGLEVSKATTGTVTYTPEGTINVAVNAHNYTPEGTISAVSAEDHTHRIETHQHGPAKTVLADVTFTANGNDTFNEGSLPSLTIDENQMVVTDIDDVYGFNTSTSNIMTAPTVNANGVLSWTLKGATKDTDSTVDFLKNMITFNEGSLPSYTQGTKASLSKSTISVAAPQEGATLTSTAGGAFTVTPTFTGTAATLSHTVGTKSFTGTGVRLVTGSELFSSTITGEANSAGAHAHALTVTTATFNNVTAVTVNNGGSATVDFSKATFTGTTATLTQAAHTHTYEKPVVHTHSIALSDTTITGTAAVAVSNHTHSIGHTHSVVIPNCQS